MNTETLREFLNEKVDKYNEPKFIESDPIQIPHLFSRKEDIEIAGFLVATIAWGNRKSIIKNGHRMMQLMDHAPFDFVMNHSPSDLESLTGFVHRTFNAEDLSNFIMGLKNIYTEQGGIESALAAGLQEGDLQAAIGRFKALFIGNFNSARSQKHIGDPLKNSAAKRINMYLRWMVRNDKRGVDFGIWSNINPAQLSCPLDVHSGSVARKLGLLKRKQNDAKAVKELDAVLRILDPLDPVKYDFALFGLGVFENF